MAQKHLKELLKEDQEPFLLKDYIANKQHQLKNQPQKTQIQVKKPKKPISKNPSFFCKNACFFSLQDSPDPHKSPLFDFTKSPCKSPNRVFLHVPAKTASLLLEAALRIQKQTKPKTQIKNSGFGLFGSMLKKFTQRNRTHKLKSSETEHRKTGENRGDLVIEEKLVNVNSSSSSSSSLSSSTSCSCNERISSLDLESSSSGRSINGCDNDDYDDDNDGFVFANLVKENDGDYGLCFSPLSPLSPFHFALRSSPSSPDRRSLMLCSPVKSPVQDNIEDNAKYEQEGSGKFQVEEDEEDKEQNSPVSVLDPPFEDDYDGHEEEGGGYDLECSYGFVQRAKQHLLHKLQRFEKLAELDPIELEKRLIEDEADYEDYDYELFSFDEETQVDEFINDIIKKSGFQDIKKPGIKRLISNLIIEEESVENATLDNEEKVIKRVCKRLESWKEVEANTIDMMVGMDLRREIGDWKKHQEQIDETAKDLEIALFAILVDELVNDL